MGHRFAPIAIGTDILHDGWNSTIDRLQSIGSRQLAIGKSSLKLNRVTAVQECPKGTPSERRNGR